MRALLFMFADYGNRKLSTDGKMAKYNLTAPAFVVASCRGRAAASGTAWLPPRAAFQLPMRRKIKPCGHGEMSFSAL